MSVASHVHVKEELMGTRRKNSSSGTRTWFPKRVRIFCMMTSAAVIVYSQRVNISIALDSDRGMATDLGWDDHAKGRILSSFLFGYAIMNICGGYLASTYGAHGVALFAMCCSSVMSALTPIAATHFGVWGIVL